MRGDMLADRVGGVVGALNVSVPWKPVQRDVPRMEVRTYPGRAAGSTARSAAMLLAPGDVA